MSFFSFFLVEDLIYLKDRGKERESEQGQAEGEGESQADCTESRA